VMVARSDAEVDVHQGPGDAAARTLSELLPLGTPVVIE